MIDYIPFQEQQSVPGEPMPLTLLPCVQHSAQLVSTSKNSLRRQEARKTSVIPQVLPRIK